MKIIIKANDKPYYSSKRNYEIAGEDVWDEVKRAIIPKDGVRFDVTVEINGIITNKTYYNEYGNTATEGR